MLDASDRIALHELVALYGHLLDQRRWRDLDQVFTDDVQFEGTTATTHSLAEKVASWSSPEGLKRHPIAHNITNPVVSEDPDGTVRIMCKGVMLWGDGRVNAFTYEDVAVRTGAGWRIARRRVTDRNKQATERGEVY